MLESYAFHLILYHIYDIILIMVRTLISLEEKDKRWLDSYSRMKHQSIAETVRKALQDYRDRIDSDDEVKKDLLGVTAGLWKGRGIDGLDYVDRLRNEW